MEIQETTLPIFYVSRIFGLAPFLINRNGKGKIADISRSLLLCIYSSFVLITTVSLTFRFIINDAKSKAPIRMKTATSKFVTTFDVCVVVGACTCGALSGILGLQNIKQMNVKLREVDRALSFFTDEAKDRRRSYYLLIIVFVVITGMISMDLTSRIRLAKKIETSLEAKEEAEDIFIQGYFPFYVLYYMLMALQTQFAQTAHGLGRRYRRLNLAIQNAFPNTCASIDPKLSNISATHIIQVSSTNKSGGETATAATSAAIATANALERSANNHNSMNTNTHSQCHSNNEIPPRDTNVLTATTMKIPAAPLKKSCPHTGPYSKNICVAHAIPRNPGFLERIAHTHALLGEAVVTVSSAFGFTLLAMLASCLLHLVATSYFLFVEILGDNDMFVSSLQLLWCAFHASRLLLIVEPCHTTSIEASRTIVIICDIMRRAKDPSIELKKFWSQLLADRTYYFSACGMCKIDRQILTSFSGAIATYLVILIQFQKTDG